MNILEFLARLFRKLFGLRPPEDPPEDRMKMKKSMEPGDPPVVEITLHSTRKLRENNGTIPEEMMARFIAQAMREAGKPYEIRWNFDPVDPAEETRRGTFDYWNEAVHKLPRHERGKDCSLLLNNTDGGGLAYVTGEVAVGPAGNISEIRPWEPTGIDDQHRNIHANLHELGHSLGLGHDHDDDQEGEQHHGMGWNDHVRKLWHRTPAVAGNGAPNACGEMVEEREYERAVRHQTYYQCAAENMQIKPMKDSYWYPKGLNS